MSSKSKWVWRTAVASTFSRISVRKSLTTLLYEFTPNYEPGLVAGDGDVKYHLGYESVREFPEGNVRVSLAANPSHLEAVNPVVEGKARARQRVLGDDGAATDRKRVLPILIHGDAAFAGQGSVAEVLNLSQLPGTAPEARFTSSSTTRSASPPCRPTHGPHPMRPMSRK